MLGWAWLSNLAQFYTSNWSELSCVTGKNKGKAAVDDVEEEIKKLNLKESLPEFEKPKKSKVK